MSNKLKPVTCRNELGNYFINMTIFTIRFGHPENYIHVQPNILGNFFIFVPYENSTCVMEEQY